MRSSIHIPKAVLVIALPILVSGFASVSAGVITCSIQSAATVAPVVELYTSEGCNSCPPADEWLSKLKNDSGIVALGFHVDYWDRLGWKDRFASAAFALRQEQERAHNGTAFNYTPEVVMDGLDNKHWNRSTPSSSHDRSVATVDVVLERIGDSYSAIVTSKNSAPARLDAFWAITEDGHVTNVKAGENKGVTLNHDFVVREYALVKAWSSVTLNFARLQFTPKHADDHTHPRHINLVVRDATSGRPVQAVKLGC